MEKFMKRGRNSVIKVHSGKKLITFNIYVFCIPRLPHLISTKTQRIFQLSFLVPPNKPIIRDGNGKKMAKTLGPYKIGDKLFATCSTTGGKL